MKISDHKVEVLPPPPKFRYLLGPSFILLGLGLGSGELILWPYLTANFGMGIIWGAILGITLQFFINMEIERYSLVRGESIFVGFARKLQGAPFWFILSTFAGFAWPGIVGASGKLLGSVFSLSNTRFIAIGLLILIGIILTLGPILYKTIEKFSMLLIAVGIPSLFLLTLFLAKRSDWQSLFKGIFGIGEGYLFLPEGIPIASFLAAFAFAGAGGNLNLAQSFYIKEKGYAMGKFSGRITSILTGKVENIRLEGAKFKMNDVNLERFRRWWKLVNFEHLIVFWLTGAISISMLGLLAYITAYGKTTPAAGIEFVLYEAMTITARTLPIFGTLFLVIGGVLLFNTQLTVFDATSRIIAENVLLLKSSSWSPKMLPKIYYLVLWSQIAFGVIIFLSALAEPLFLLILSAVINAFAMFVHIGLTLWLNKKELEPQVAISNIRAVIMIVAMAFFGYFSIRTLLAI